MKSQVKKQDVLITKDGVAGLQGEIDELKNVKLPAVMERIARAREDGDLSENSAYQFGKQEQEFIEGRIDELEDVLKHATIIKSSTIPGSKGVDIGCKVTVSVNGKKHIFTVVGDWEANPKDMKISGNSPMGKALMGKSIGDKAEVQAPAGKVIYTILEIE